VVALGASTNDGLIPGSSKDLTFKTMADALVLRNHLIERFERADATADSVKRCECLTVVVIGGGLVGIELVGELTAFADDVLRFYPRIRRDEVRFRLFEAGPRILRRSTQGWPPRRRACSNVAVLTSKSRPQCGPSRPDAYDWSTTLSMPPPSS